MHNNPSEIVRAHIWVKGRVQGVGFRAHVEYLALENGVVGWVRNVGRETVEMMVEGDREIVEHFIDMVQEGPRMARVDESKVEWEPVTGEFSSFGVKPNI